MQAHLTKPLRMEGLKEAAHELLASPGPIALSPNSVKPFVASLGKALTDAAPGDSIRTVSGASYAID